MTYWNRFQETFEWAFGLRKIFGLQDVFTSGSPADINYVKRPELESSLKQNIKVKGKQIAVFGHSGSGKTTIVQKVLHELNQEFIYTPCSSTTTFNDLLIAAFDELDPYYIDSKSSTATAKVSANVQTEYLGIKSSLTGELSEAVSTSMKRVLPPQLTPKKLADFLGEAHCCWIIEDFHKIAKEERQLLADCLKIFIDQGAKYPDMRIICIGVVGSAHDLLSYDTNLNPRVAEIEIPLLNDEENRQLVLNGCSLLNIEMDYQMVNNIISYSNRIASVAHQMCYDICYKNSIESTCKHKKYLTYEKFADALKSYIEAQSDTLKFLYEGATRADIGWYVLRTLANSGWDKVSIEGISKAVNQNHKNKRFSHNQIYEKLQELSLPEIGIVKYDANSDKYSLASPFWGAFIKMQQRVEYNKKQKKRKILIEDQQGIDAILHNLLLQEIERIQRM